MQRPVSASEPTQPNEVALRELQEPLRALNAAAGWLYFGEFMPPQPRPQIVPALWRYRDLIPLLLRAGELISSDQAERRVVTLENPAMPGQARVTRPLTCALQLVLAGERVRTHRHAANAFRFILEGEGAYSTVDGERVEMQPGDLLITPSQAWHDHTSYGESHMVWLDGLDLHLVNFLDAPFFEVSKEPVQPLIRRDGRSYAEAGFNMLPVGRELDRAAPICRYPYARTLEALAGLARAADPDPWHAFKMRYINPLTGSWPLATIATTMQSLPEGFETRPYRSTEGAIFVVVEGAGESVIGGQTFRWSEHDVLVAPSWTTHQHRAARDAVIFSYSDRATQEKLGLFREERGAQS